MLHFHIFLVVFPEVRENTYNNHISIYTFSGVTILVTLLDGKLLEVDLRREPTVNSSQFHKTQNNLGQLTEPEFSKCS